MDRLTRDGLTQYLRDALNHLHDADHLRRSPLAALFGVANRLDTASALRNLLIEAIESLKPQEDDPQPAHAWQMHDALFCCYVQRLSQRVVADQLAVSERQLRREQRAAFDALADRLCEHFRLGTPQSQAEEPATKPAAVSEELAWLKDIPPEKPTDLDETLRMALELVGPLAQQHGTHLDIQTGEPLPKLAVHPVALSQILTNALGAMIARTPGGRVHIAAHAEGWGVRIRVQGGQAPAGAADVACLEMARQLVEMCAGEMATVRDAAATELTITLPALERLPILVIDDNADTLQLLDRYTAGTRYHIIGARDPEQALSLAEARNPQAIVLDVMMPQVDGWKVLGRLRQHPRTGHIPVIVCTIMPQEALALSLGASAFVSKPISRQAFLGALDAQIPATARAVR